MTASTKSMAGLNTASAPTRVGRPAARDLSWFWSLQIGAFIVGAITGFAVTASVTHSVGAALIFAILSPSFGIALTFLLRWHYDRVLRRTVSVPAIGLHILLASLAAAMCLTAILDGFHVLGLPYNYVLDTSPLLRFGGATLFRSVYFDLWSTLYFWCSYQSQARVRREGMEQAERAAREAEILMLRAQVAPHFLFNALNTILAELDTNPAGAASIVHNLSDYFRYSLRNRTTPFVPLGEEYDAILAFLAVEQSRYPDSLRLDCRIDPAARDIRVPGIILHPLAENALQYGDRSDAKPLRLRLHVVRTPDGGAAIEVANSGTWFDRPDPRRDGDIGGNGLTTLRRRLALLYPGQDCLEIQTSGGEVSIRLSLPPR
ncbi:MAG: histidine kinase [Rhodospirillales bacterium]